MYLLCVYILGMSHFNPVDSRGTFIHKCMRTFKKGTNHQLRSIMFREHLQKQVCSPLAILCTARRDRIEYTIATP